MATHLVDSVLASVSEARTGLDAAVLGHGCLHKFRVLFVGVLTTRKIIVIMLQYSKGPDFRKLPCGREMRGVCSD